MLPFYYTMQDITLHYLFRKIVKNDKFLLTVIEPEPIKKNKKNQNMINLINNVSIGESLLTVGEVVPYVDLPKNIQQYTNANYSKIGVKNIIDKDLATVNISFLNSLNNVLRSDLCTLSIDDQLKDLQLFENFIVHKISRNYKIDKTKNTKKVQMVNKKLIQDLMDGKITHDLIQNIVNIFEINLVVFDSTNQCIIIYWAHGTKYPFFNLFKNIHFLCYSQGNYNPLITLKQNTADDISKIYLNILKNLNDIDFKPPINNGILSLFYIFESNISLHDFGLLATKMFPPKDNNFILDQVSSIY